MFPRLIEDLVKEFGYCPGIGPKTAQKFVSFLLKKTPEELARLSQKIKDLNQIKACSLCGNFAEKEVCYICEDPKRDHSLICLVANPLDLEIIEKIGEYKGVYEILGGLIDTTHGIKPEHLNINRFFNRLHDKKNRIREVIFALSPNLEGETTILYLLDLIKQDKNISKDVKLSRLAKGLSSGMELEYADSLTLSEAFKERKSL